MASLKVLAIAVASGRAGYVYLQETKLLDWGMTVKATKDPAELVAFVQSLINDLKPDVVVTEKCDALCRKGKKARRLIAAIADLASHNYVLDISLARPRHFPSKYEEAVHFVKRHPEITGYLPKKKRRIFDFEPRTMMIFEALALAEQALISPPEALAAAMG
ncbi:hypothetical protein [Roseovarius sp. 2305UL8-3]|uniref:hypothetical protein n=1 Tax=Roseovarius conchicola TaxID=3121636 RepID=UPI0035284733